jgi:uncharacterized protein (DUF58 family)
MTEVDRGLPSELRERLSKLELHARSVVEGMISGLHKSPYHGFSVEFAQHREYSFGDDIKHVDWKVFGRTDRYYIKQYEEETNLGATMLLDCSESMLYRSEDPAVTRTKYEHGALAACALAFLLLRQQDSTGLLTFDDDVRSQVPSSSHPLTLKRFVETIAAVEPRERSEVGALFPRLSEAMKRRGMVFLISDLFFDREALVTGLRQLRHRGHEVVVFHVLDPDELSFPFSENTRFIGYEAMESFTCDPRSLRDAYLEAMQSFRSEVERACSDCRVDYLLLDTSQQLERVLPSYLQTYRRRR